MLKKIFLLLFLVFVLAGCQEVTGDGDEDQDKPALSGYYKSSYGDGFEISGSNFYYYDMDKTGGFVGQMVNYSGLAASSGFITLKIISIPSGSFWTLTPNNFYCIRWKNYDGLKVSESSAYKSGSSYNNGYPGSLESAELEYLGTNYDSLAYFGGFADYNKQ